MVPVAELKVALAIPAARTEYDAYLLDLEAAAVAHVARVTGWYVGESVAADIVVVGTGGGILDLPERASAVSGVASRAYEGGTETTIATGADDGWVLRIPPGSTHGMQLVRRGGEGWARGTEYVVSAVVGYLAGGEPADDRADVVALVAHWYEARLPVAVGTIAAHVPLHVGARLAARRRVRV